MMRALYILKRHHGWAEVASNSEIIKPVALTVIELCLPEDISKSVSQQKIKSLPLKQWILCRHRF